MRCVNHKQSPPSQPQHISLPQTNKRHSTYKQVCYEAHTCCHLLSLSFKTGMNISHTGCMLQHQWLLCGVLASRNCQQLATPISFSRQVLQICCDPNCWVLKHMQHGQSCHATTAACCITKRKCRLTAATHTMQVTSIPMTMLTGCCRAARNSVTHQRKT